MASDAAAAAVALVLGLIGQTRSTQARTGRISVTLADSFRLLGWRDAADGGPQPLQGKVLERCGAQRRDKRVGNLHGAERRLPGWLDTMVVAGVRPRDRWQSTHQDGNENQRFEPATHLPDLHLQTSNIF